MSGEALEAWAIKEQCSIRVISMLKTSYIYRRHRSCVEDIPTERRRHLLNQQTSGFSFFVLKLKTSALRVQTTNPADVTSKTRYYFCVKTGNNLLWSETYTSLCAQVDTQIDTQIEGDNKFYEDDWVTWMERRSFWGIQVVNAVTCVWMETVWHSILFLVTN